MLRKEGQAKVKRVIGVVDTWFDGLTLRQGKIAWKQ
jgi:hypothetical protein